MQRKQMSTTDKHFHTSPMHRQWSVQQFTRQRTH
jgi:hypothetical protein